MVPSVYLSKRNKAQINSPGLTLEPIPLVFTIQNSALRSHTLHGCWSFRFSSSQVFCLFCVELIRGQCWNESQHSQLILSPAKGEKLLPKQKGGMDLSHKPGPLEFEGSGMEGDTFATSWYNFRKSRKAFSAFSWPRSIEVHSWKHGYWRIS